MHDEILWWFSITGLEGTGTPPRATANAATPRATAAARPPRVTASAPRPR